MRKYVPDDAIYTKEHLWLRFEGKKVCIGITEYLAEEIGRVTELDLPEEDDEIDFETEFGFIAGKNNNGMDLFSPLSGTIAEVNAEAMENPKLVSDDPYDEGWLVVLKGVNKDELEEPMTAEEYGEYLQGLEE